MLRILQKLILAISVCSIIATPSQAMFIQPDWLDPTEPGVGTNRYSYSHNDPVNRRDPSGNSDEATVLLGGAAGIGCAASGVCGAAVLLGLGAIVVGKLAYDYATQPESSVSVGDGMISASVPGLGEVLGPGEDISNPGAAEPNIGRERPYGEVIEGIRGLPGAEVIGEFETPWGKGEVIELPDGTKIAARPGSKSGGPTIEVTDPDGNTEKNRFPEQESQQERDRDSDSDRTQDRD